MMPGRRDKLQGWKCALDSNCKRFLNYFKPIAAR